MSCRRKSVRALHVEQLAGDAAERGLAIESAIATAYQLTSSRDIRISGCRARTIRSSGTHGGAVALGQCSQSGHWWRYMRVVVRRSASLPANGAKRSPQRPAKSTSYSITHR